MFEPSGGVVGQSMESKSSGRAKILDSSGQVRSLHVLRFVCVVKEKEHVIKN